MGPRSILLLGLVVAAGASCHEPRYADGELSCSPESLCPYEYTCLPVVCPANGEPGKYACFLAHRGDPYPLAPLYAVDGHCDREGCENAVNSPEDCGQPCDPLALSAGVPQDLLASLITPPSLSRASIDLDGDGTHDNRLGRFVDLLDPDGELFDELAIRALEGELLLVSRFWIDPSPPLWHLGVAAQILPAEVYDATPEFRGRDVVALASEPYGDPFLCAEQQWDQLLGQRATEELMLPLPLAEEESPVPWVPAHSARLIARLDGDRITSVEIAFGLDPSTVQALVVPWAARRLTSLLASGGTAGEFVRDYVDGMCDPRHPGCDPLPLSCEADGVITPDELRCNGPLGGFTQPDVDLDGDGEGDVLSVGYGLLDLVPVTVAP